MKLLFKIVLILIITVTIVLAAKLDTHYAYFTYGDQEIFLSRTLFIILILLFYVLLNRAIGLVSNLWNLSENVKTWQTQKRKQQAVTSYNQGMLAMAEGQWRTAERKFMRHVLYAEMPINNCLYAARAAQQLGEIERRDEYLLVAYELKNNSTVPVDITRAELQLSQNQTEQALATLKHLRESEPKNEYILKMLLDLYKELDDWSGIRDILPDLKRRSILEATEAEKLELTSYTRLIEESDNNKNLNELQHHWNVIPKAFKENPGLIYHYAAKMIHYGFQKDVEPLLRNYLKKNWDEKIVALYSQIDIETIGKNYNQIESLAEEHGSNPTLLLALGKICIKNKLWGKARSYFESSIGVMPSVEAYNELGLLLEDMGEQNGAMDCYRNGMQLGLKQAS